MKVLYDMNNHTVFICLASKETSHISIPLFLANTPLPRALFLNESLNQYLGPDRSLQSIRPNILRLITDHYTRLIDNYFLYPPTTIPSYKLWNDTQQKVL